MDQKIQEILSELQKLRSIDFNGYRTAMLKRRIKSRMTSLNIDDMDEYIKVLKSSVTESENLINAIAINYSLFFRNPIVYEILAESILPSIIENKRKSKSKEIRIWSAGCAAGEEAYSIAILINEILEKEIEQWLLYIFATDIDTSTLNRAREAIFQRESLENAKLGILDKYFIHNGNSYELKSVIKQIVQFSHDDLTSQKTIAPTESVFGSFDLVLCRNVLIYFSRELQDRVFSKLYRSLSPKGYLILGESESLNSELGTKFKTLDYRNRIFQKQI